MSYSVCQIGPTISYWFSVMRAPRAPWAERMRSPPNKARRPGGLTGRQTDRHMACHRFYRLRFALHACSVFLVFEYCTHDLGRLVDSMARPFGVSEVKCLLRQLLEATAFLHDRWVMHRDLKLSNLLLTADGCLKLCDFGLARYFKPYEEPYTPNVVTLWYRCAGAGAQVDGKTDTGCG
jgi:serine/threonine protein kinase